MVPKGYEIRKEQVRFVEEASASLKKGGVFLGSAPCGTGKSLASLLAVLPCLTKKKLLISFRTRSQLHIYLKELRALGRAFRTVSFYSKKAMCPLRVKSDLSYFDFFDECKRLKDNCRTSTKPFCKFFWNVYRRKKRADELAADCTKRVLTPQQAVKYMSKEGFCAYEALKRVLKDVDIFLGTYHYVFSPPIRDTLLKSLGTDLSNVYIIADEAHNLPTFSRELLSDRITENTVDNALRETEEFTDDSSSLVQGYLKVLNAEIFERAPKLLEREGIKQINPQKTSDLFLDRLEVPGVNMAETIHDYGESVVEKRRDLGYERVFSYSHRVGEFLKAFFEKTGPEYAHLIERDWKNRISVEVESLDGRDLTDPVLRDAAGSILMSGFLSPPDVYRDLMLYNQEAAYLREFNNPFPPENRLILAAEDVSSKFNQRTGEMLQKWREYIKTIAEVNEGNMAVFFTSYALLFRMLPILKIEREKIIEQRKTRRREVLEELQTSDDKILLGVMGGKFSEGIDYEDNVLSCVVAVGLPYATWNVYQKSLIDYFEQKFHGKGRIYAYVTPAILRLIQTCGRVHRSPEDKGCIVILDRRVTDNQTKQWLPKYYQREMQTVSSPDGCAGKIEKFWKRTTRTSHNLYL